MVLSISDAAIFKALHERIESLTAEMKWQSGEKLEGAKNRVVACSDLDPNDWSRKYAEDNACAIDIDAKITKLLLDYLSTFSADFVRKSVVGKVNSPWFLECKALPQEEV